METYKRILGGLFGVACGDALVEHLSLCQKMRLKENMDT